MNGLDRPDGIVIEEQQRVDVCLDARDVSSFAVQVAATTHRRHRSRICGAPLHRVCECRYTPMVVGQTVHSVPVTLASEKMQAAQLEGSPHKLGHAAHICRDDRCAVLLCLVDDEWRVLNPA